MTNKELIKDVEKMIKPLSARITELEQVLTEVADEPEEDNDNIKIKGVCEHQQGQEKTQQEFFNELKSLMLRYKVVKANVRLEIKL